MPKTIDQPASRAAVALDPLVSGSSRAMLDKWAAKLNERRAIADFHEWLLAWNYHDYRVADLRIETLLDLYHEIDQAQLDKERRALLEAANVKPSDGANNP